MRELYVQTMLESFSKYDSYGIHTTIRNKKLYKAHVLAFALLDELSNEARATLEKKLQQVEH